MLLFNIAKLNIPIPISIPTYLARFTNLSIRRCQTRKSNISNISNISNSSYTLINTKVANLETKISEISEFQKINEEKFVEINEKLDLINERETQRFTSWEIISDCAVKIGKFTLVGFVCYLIFR